MLFYFMGEREDNHWPVLIAQARSKVVRKKVCSTSQNPGNELTLNKNRWTLSN